MPKEVFKKQIVDKQSKKERYRKQFTLFPYQLKGKSSKDKKLSILSFVEDAAKDIIGSIINKNKIKSLPKKNSS